MKTCVITSAQESGCCEQEVTQKQRRRVTFRSLSWSLLSQLEYGNEAEAVFGASVTTWLTNYVDKMTDCVTRLIVARNYICPGTQFIKMEATV